MHDKIIDILNSIEISHLFAKNHKHGLELYGEWKLFEPTKFVYAFFSFNMIYSIDWDSTINLNRINYNNNKAKILFIHIINFITDFDVELFENELSKFDPERKLYNVIRKMTDDRNSNKLSEFTNNTIAQDFKMASKKFSAREKLNSDDHFDLLQMAYTVRNNIFHGEKKAMDMVEAGQRDRLLHYANIILATNESFFEVMRRKYGYKRIENYEVADNII
jgi:hypothetical protein